jgi:DNA-binding response OmpR family regulator
LLGLIEQQPAWSDLPIVLLTHHGGPEQNPASRFGPQLGNVTFLERPFHPETLISLVTTALRGRRRQYEARDRLIDLSQSELRLQNTLETLEQQVEERTAQLRHNEEVLRQSQKMEAVGQLTGGIAHDFNNMLTGIIGSLELLRRRLARGRTEDLDSLIDLGVTSANRAAGLTHRLLAFSRRQSLDSKPVEMNNLVISMGELLQRSINESIRLDMQLSEHLWVAEADPNQLESALLNLVINARDAMPDGGKLVVGPPTRSWTPASPKPTATSNPVTTWTQRHRQWLRHAAKRDQPRFRPVLHHQAHRPGHRPGVVDDLWLQQTIPWPCRHSQRSGQGTTVSLFLPRFGGDLPRTIRSFASPVRAEWRNGADRRGRPGGARAGEYRAERAGLCLRRGWRCSRRVAGSRFGQRIDLMISDVGLPGMNGRQLAEIGRQYRPG